MTAKERDGVPLQHHGVAQLPLRQPRGGRAGVLASNLDAEEIRFRPSMCGLRQKQSFAAPDFNFEGSRHVEQLGLAGADVLLIGDALDDARAARAIGADVILLDSGTHHRSDLESTGAAVIRTLSQLLDRL